MRITLTTLLLACLAGVCAAQQTPMPQPPPQNDARETSPSTNQGKVKPAADIGTSPAADQDAGKNADDQAAPARPKSRLAPPSTLFAELGYGVWDLSGNRSKFRQYATVPSGFFLSDLRYVPLLKPASENAFFDVKGLGQDDYRAETRLNWGYGTTQVSGFLSRFQFMDPLPNPVSPDSRHIEGITAKQDIARDFALSLQYRNDAQVNNYDVPYSNLNQDTQYMGAAATGKLGHGFATLDFSNLFFKDYTGTLQDTTTQTTGLSYLWTPSDAIDIEAAFSHVAILQQAQSHVDTMSLTGDFALGSATELNFGLQQRNLSLPTVQSAYVRSQGLGTVSLFEHWKSWRAQVGFRLQNDQRVNGDQNYVDVPKWSTMEARVSGKLPFGWRLNVRGYMQTLFNPPSAITDDPASLYWNSQNYLQARLEGGITNVDYYLIYTYQIDRNSARGSVVQTNQYTAGSIWQISQAISLFGEFHHESWSGSTGMDAAPTLDSFLPDSTTGMLELTWNLRRLFLSASFTGFGESNANPLLLQNGNASGRFFSFNGHYRFPHGYELGLSVTPWYYRDNVASALNYDAAVVMVTGSARF